MIARPRPPMRRPGAQAIADKASDICHSEVVSPGTTPLSPRRGTLMPWLMTTLSAGIVLSHPSKSYGDVRAVRSIDLTIAPGETVALLGPNGAGKTTTIDMVLGLTRPDSGSVCLFGMSPARAVAAGIVGGMLQTGSLIPHLSVRELLTVVASLYPRPLPVDEVLRLTGTAEFADRRTTKLPEARRSGSAAPSRWSRIRTCSCSMSRPPPSTLTAVASSGPRCEGPRRAARP